MTQPNQRTENQRLAELLARPPTTVPEVLATQEEIMEIAQTWPRGKEDGLSCFNYLYHVITKDVLTRIQEDQFKNPKFIPVLDVEFAKRYFNAVYADATGADVPRSWAVLFQRRSNPNIDPQLFAIAGVNAHVNFDLAFAVVTTCAKLGCSYTDTEVHSDYQAVNDIFAQNMADLRQHFEGWLGRLLDKNIVKRALNNVDDLTVVVARDAAWHRAELLSALSDAERGRMAEVIDWRTAMVGRGVLDL